MYNKLGKKGTQRISNKWLRFVNLQVILGMITFILSLLGMTGGGDANRPETEWFLKKAKTSQTPPQGGTKPTNCVT